jgi:hypothetical protein
MAKTTMSRMRVSFTDPLTTADPGRAADTPPPPDVWVTVPMFIEPKADK